MRGLAERSAEVSQPGDGGRGAAQLLVDELFGLVDELLLAGLGQGIVELTDGERFGRELGPGGRVSVIGLTSQPILADPKHSAEHAGIVGAEISDPTTLPLGIGTSTDPEGRRHLSLGEASVPTYLAESA